MCGIFCILSPEYEYNQNFICDIYEKCHSNLNRRGPDSKKLMGICLENWNFLLSSSVLWLQGSTVTPQPIETNNFLFLYNGDVFGNLIPSNIRSLRGDTIPLLEELEHSDNIAHTLSRISGPFAFILINKAQKKLYFGRDTYGRRSLLIGRDNNKLLLTSVASKDIKSCIPLIELPALGIYCLDLNSNVLESLTLVPWKSSNQKFQEKLTELQVFLSLFIEVKFDCVDKFEIESSTKYNNLILPNSYQSTINILESYEKSAVLSYIVLNSVWSRNITTLKMLLEESVERRIKNQPNCCSLCTKNKFHCNHATLGILFSGGVDCAILALLADKFIDCNKPIDLINVSFQKTANTENYNTPDRITSRRTLNELKLLRPDRHWNLLEVNVSQEELNYERKHRISDLIYPLDTILDDSLGCALWFAARAKTLYYESTARVLLVGMGADELFGGYMRHRAAFKRGGWSLLAEELDNDWKNISHRNLARDDRVISDHGRQVRTPYLDENVVEFVRNLKPWERCFPMENVQGIGDKLLLRCLAHNLGLTNAAVLKKRALQFGSRIANSKENAHEKSPRLV